MLQIKNQNNKNQFQKNLLYLAKVNHNLINHLNPKRVRLQFNWQNQHPELLLEKKLFCNLELK